MRTSSAPVRLRKAATLIGVRQPEGEFISEQIQSVTSSEDQVSGCLSFHDTAVCAATKDK